MCRKHGKGWLRHGMTVMVVTSISLASVCEGAAAEDAALRPVASSADAAMSPERTDKDIISVELPVIPQEKASPLDFFLDPCGLLYDTDAVRYGGGSVEEGATLLFYNQEGEYDLSSCSDPVEIANRGGAPVVVTISASISDLGEIQIDESGGFSEGEGPGIYLAIADDQGNEQPIPADGELLFSQEIDEDSYFFWLTGACGPDVDWKDTDPSIRPKVKVTWHVEPVEKEEGAPEGLGEQPAPQGAAEAGAVPGGDGGAGGQSADAEGLGGQAGAQIHPDGATENPSGQSGANGTVEAPVGPDEMGDGTGSGTSDQNKEDDGTGSGTSDQNKGDGTGSTSDQNKGDGTGGISDQNKGDGSDTSDQNKGDGTGGISDQNKGDGSGTSDQNKGGGTGGTSDQNKGDDTGSGGDASGQSNTGGSEGGTSGQDGSSGGQADPNGSGDGSSGQGGSGGSQTGTGGADDSVQP